jgi:hypothetical protein
MKDKMSKKNRKGREEAGMASSNREESKQALKRLDSVESIVATKKEAN